MNSTNQPILQNNQSDFNKVLQSVSLGSERLEEFNSRTDSTENSPKVRVRYSGAARRRYKKEKFQREKESAKAQICPIEVVPNSETGEGEVPAVTSKRAWPELSTPSPTNIQDKRPKISYQESYAPKDSVKLDLPLERYPDKSEAPAVTSKRAWSELSTPSPTDIQGKRPKISDQESYAPKGFVTLALTLEGYPDKRLGVGECSIIRKLIRERILELSEDTKAPTFSGSWERDGALVFTCVDEQSGDWLKNLSSDLKLGENSLCVLSVDELPKRHRVMVHVEESDVSAEEALKLLGKQNTGLATNDWIVIKESESRDATNTHFACLIRDPSLETLKACNFKPFCGLGQATVRLLEKERKKDFQSIKVTIKEEVI
ncbi:hypothetical protein EAG_05614 [Camponotus floridanus]|uniref:DUF4780 domain-containing protein n=1 Tax=Camponotus floridanus TaxID=104421 RepID=E2A7S5_CAMFO|nr:uncharacterized protein LOC112639430 [Camponotus floridanus]EFN70505.1 hypothetical protein EAG_05614 [Camponotus floridanus]